MEKDQAFYVYALYRDTEMTFPFYIGKGRRQRMNQHAVIVARDVSHRANTIRQIVKELGFLPRRKLAEHMTEENAYKLEIELIKQFGVWPDGPLLNRTAGGDQLGGLGRRWTPEERAKVSATMKGRKKTPEHVANAAAALRGRTVSAETRERLRLSHLGQKPWNAGTRKPRAPSPRKPQKTPRKDAKAMGLTRYVSGKPCPQGHIGERFVSGGGCVQCYDHRRELRRGKELIPATSQPCRNGHISPRRPDNGDCVQCTRDRANRHYAKLSAPIATGAAASAPSPARPRG